MLLSFYALPGYAAPLRVVALGDSLTAGYGLKGGEDYASRLEAALKKKGLDVTIANAGVSGDTTAGGVSRLDWAIAGKTPPDLVIIALGANDMLRGVSPEITEKNLEAILKKLAQKNIPAVLYGMRTPVNLPLAYRTKFESIYPRLAKKYDVALYPFFLEGVATNPTLNLADGVHPNTKGIAVMVEKTVPIIYDALKRIQNKK